MLLQGGGEGQAAAVPPTPAVAAGPSGSPAAAVAARRAEIARGKQPLLTGTSGDTASDGVADVQVGGIMVSVYFYWTSGPIASKFTLTYSSCWAVALLSSCGAMHADASSCCCRAVVRGKLQLCRQHLQWRLGHLARLLLLCLPAGQRSPGASSHFSQEQQGTQQTMGLQMCRLAALWCLYYRHRTTCRRPLAELWLWWHEGA